MNKLENLKKKILYRSSYRGTKEMDLLLTLFVKKYINELNEAELDDLNNFLNLEDEVINNFYFNLSTGNKIKKNKIFELFAKFKI